MQNINVNIVPDSYPQTIRYSQGDVGREFKINVVGFTIPTGATVKIQATKPSGFGFSVAGTVSGNAVSFTTTAIMTDEAGRFPAELEITKDSVVIGTANFIMWGEANPHPEGTTDGQQGTIIPELTLLVERVEAAASSVLDMQVVAETLAAGSQASYSYDEDTNTATFGIPQGEAGAGAAGVVASAYSASATYKVGDYVIHNSNLYRCTTAITTAEAFTAAHWTQIVLADDVSDLKSDLDEVTEDIYFAKVTDNLSVESSGITFAKESDNTLKLYGTATGNRRQLFLNGQSDIMVSSSAFQKTLGAGTYHIEASAEGTGANIWYLQYSYLTFANGDVLVNYANPSKTVTFESPVMIGLSFSTNQNYGTSESPTYLTLKITKLTAKDTIARDELSKRLLASTNDNTDRTTEINNLLTQNKIVKLGVGEFHVGKLTVPSGCTLEGCGEKTVIVKIATDDNVPTVMANSKATIKDLTIKGTLTEQPTAETVIDKNRIGIAIDGVVEPVIIQNCRIIGFTYSGINIKDTGTSVKSVLISNCELTFNRVGINIVSSEYGEITNVICRDNYIGCNNGGGNNKFVNCGFDSNGYGFVLADDANDGHGSCVACSFNHNIDRAISIGDINFGFVFSGCQIHYGTIMIDDSSKGILFVGCEFGGDVVIAQYTANFPLFINSCVFYQDVREAVGYVATNIIYNDSYLFDGTAVTNN